MDISIKYNSIFATVTGQHNEIIEVENNSTVETVVDLLGHKYGDRFKDLVYMNSGARKYLVSFLVNRRLSSHGKVLDQGDEIFFIYALGGG